MGAPERGPTFVGRTSELAVVDDVLAAVRAGRTAAMVVSGEAGLGKSRLVGELRQRATAGGALVATGRTPVEGVGLPYGTLVGLLRDLRRQLRPEDRERLEPVHRLLLGEATERGQLARLALFELALEAVEDIAAARPLVLVLEDVHWADAGSVDLLDHLVRNLEDCPILVVATYRPDEMEARAPLRKVIVELRRLPSTTAIDLRGLTRDEVGALVAEATGQAQSWAVVDAIHRRSDGNPLFAEELIEVRDRDELPPALRELLTVRIDGLPASSRRVVGAASVLGASLDHRLLAAITGLDAADLDAAVRDAVRHGVLVVDGTPPTIRFRHMLLQETAHDALLPAERAGMHARAAEILAADSAVDVGAGNLAAQLAEHRYEAGDWAGACEAATAAARAGLALYSIHAAHAQAMRAIDAHRRAAGSCRHEDIDRSELHRIAAETAYLVTDVDLAVELATEAYASLPDDATPARLASTATLLARSAFAVGQVDIAFDTVASTEQRLRGQGDVAALAEVVCMDGRLLMATGRCAESVARCEEALVLARQSGAREVEGHAYATLGPSLGELGELDRALAAGEASVVVAEEVGEPELLLRAYNNLTDVQFQLGRLADAADLAVASLNDTSPLGMIRLGSAGFNGTEALITLGRWDEASTLSIMLSGKASAACVSDALNIALLALRRGALDTVESELGRRAGTSSQSVSQRETIAAEVAIERGRPDDALAAIDRALAALAGSDYGIELLHAHAVGLRALADHVGAPVRGRRRDADAITKATRAAEAALGEIEAKVASATPRGMQPTPWLRALRALAYAEASRVQQSDADLWSAAAASWEELGDPYRVAYCRLREAEALLAARGDRRRATDLLEGAWRASRQLGAALLAERCEKLAERARIALEDPRAPEASPRLRAAADLGLTAREVEVLDLLARDRTDGQIADELFISKKTASVHVSNILRKLDARDRWHAGETGRSAGLGQ